MTTKEPKQNKQILALIAIPLLIFLNLYIFSNIAELLTKADTFTVIIGIVLTALVVYLNYHVFKYIVKTILNE